MEFDKSKVYTALNADEVKAGSKGYVGDSLGELEEAVQFDNRKVFGELEEVRGKFSDYRFVLGGARYFQLFYLVEEPEEKKVRPYRNIDEMIEDFKKRYNSYSGWNCPLIWLKHIDTGSLVLITSFSKTNNSVAFTGLHIYHCLGILFEQYTYLDGSPCGIEEE